MTKYGKMLETYYSKKPICDYSPLHVYVEPTNYCNLSCQCCPNSFIKRPRGFMDMGLYKKIVRECSDLSIAYIYLFYLGESTLHKNIKEMIDLAHEANVKIRLCSNGTSDVSGLGADDLWISANHTNFEEMQENLDKLIEKSIPFKVSLIEDVSLWLPERFEDHVFYKKYYNWLGQLPGENADSERIDNDLCSHPYKAFIILWDGKCVPCEVDYDGFYVIGDLMSDGIMDVWNSEMMQAIRKAPASICKECNLIRPPMPEKK